MAISIPGRPTIMNASCHGANAPMMGNEIRPALFVQVSTAAPAKYAQAGPIDIPIV